MLPTSDGSWYNTLSKRTRGIIASKRLKYVGKNINIEKGAIYSTEVSLGNDSGIGINCLITGEVEIGNNVMMGPEVIVFTTNHRHDRVDIPMIEQGFEAMRPVVIGNDVWIGQRVIILPGVTIGDGCIIGAGAVVSKDVDSYSVFVGNPGRVVKKRIL